VGGPLEPHPSRRRERLSLPTKLAVLVGPGDVIGYEQQWRTVRAARTTRGPMGGLAVVITWEDGGSARFPAGDELPVRR
jgi:hypothetical protein